MTQTEPTSIELDDLRISEGLSDAVDVLHLEGFAYGIDQAAEPDDEGLAVAGE